MDFVDLYISEPSAFSEGMFEGNPRFSAHLEDDSNSQNGVPDDWTSEPQLKGHKQGAMLVILTNVEIEVALCEPTELPAGISGVPIKVRVATGGITQYAVKLPGSRSRVFIRRAT